MTQLAAIAQSFLKGETNSIMTAFRKFNCTNLPREVGRSIERKFGVEVTKVPVKFKSTYGHTGEYFNYTLLRTPSNKKGIQKMEEYVSKQTK
jgi:hypothetical protein